ncbi:outer membrane beta-barrel domain-containing protein [Aliiglaciecola sp. LCG003]|uniref:outer membrane beta-barrel domain-containing protein n=1 Tax=Aliiglaciecola sp. LCG003 TaxID=3053655 RepID=UPI00257456EA|nr:outer membrane beta-barrel domain-containing protein [Aliiglaciecola sp. LCG003]WJG08759.1 outer membrane beta-barrel domain-containing protein [Aliiglaciecola sp. LCG003]
METRICSIFLGVMLLGSASHAVAQQAEPQDTRTSTQTVFEPDLQRRDINAAKIDSENFELGLFVGVLSIEDFSSNAVIGARVAYHVNEDFFVEASYAQSKAGKTSFEKLSGGAPFLTEDERDYTYYNLSLGYNLNGEVFVSNDLVFNSATYFTLGAGSTDFAGDSRFTISAGAGYRLLLTDYFALHVGLKDHIFNSEIIGEEKATHNIEYGLGATFFF